MMSKVKFHSQNSEIKLMEYMNSLYLSGMAALEKRDETPDLTGEQTYNATYKITRAETMALNEFFGGIDRRLLRKKHKAALEYTQQAEEWLASFEPEIDDSPEELKRFCEGFVRMLTELHEILHEDTQQKLRDRVLDTMLDAGAAAYFNPTGAEANG
jgi:hypothetical protein